MCRISTHTPLARRDWNWHIGRRRYKFLLTRLSRGVTEAMRDYEKHHKISTHTPLARRDGYVSNDIDIDIDFYSHASREA